MAFEESFGGQVDPGRPYFLKHDPQHSADMSVVIIPLELEHRDKMNMKYGERKRNKRTKEMDWIIPDKQVGAANSFLAARIWKNSENAWVKLSNPEAVELYNKEIEPAKPFVEGDEVLMDGLWTDALKADLLNLKMANWIVTQGTDAQADADIGDAEEKEKNSQSGSSSELATTPPSPKLSAVDVN